MSFNMMDDAVGASSRGKTVCRQPGGRWRPAIRLTRMLAPLTGHQSKQPLGDRADGQACGDTPATISS
jgi:hypothetical protein